MTHAGEPEWLDDEDRARFLEDVETMSDEEAAAWAVVTIARRDEARAAGESLLALLLDAVVHALGERHLRRMEWVRYMREATAPPPAVCRPLTDEELREVDDDDLVVEPEVAAAEADVVRAIARLHHVRTAAAVRAMLDGDGESDARP